MSAFNRPNFTKFSNIYSKSYVCNYDVSLLFQTYIGQDVLIRYNMKSTGKIGKPILLENQSLFNATALVYERKQIYKLCMYVDTYIVLTILILY